MKTVEGPTVREESDTTVSVRISKDLAAGFEETCRILPLNKSEFLRAAIEKIVRDNAPLVEHIPKLGMYIEALKKKLGTLPNAMIEVDNGTWKTVAEATVLELADEIRARVKDVKTIYDDLAAQYSLEWQPAEADEHVLDIGAIALLGMPRREVDPDDIFSQDHPNGPWTDEVELSKILLILSLQKALSKFGPRRVVETFIAALSKEEGRKVRIVLDARGTYGRSGDSLVTPVDWVKIDDS